jgi:lipopolysaccharide transport system permease protein
MNIKQAKWDEVLKPKSNFFNFNFLEIWKYRDLVLLFVHRNFVATHKQTILGPLWHFIQPLMTTIAFTLVFSEIAKVPTDNIAPFLFFMTGNTIWGFFSRCLTSTSNTFTANAGLFGKVYFPRLIVPIANVTSSLISFGIQFILLMAVYSYYIFFKDYTFPWSFQLLWIPMILVLMLIMGLGLGIIISALTTQYRDLTYFIGFGVQLLMYISPVIYPLSAVPEKYQKIALINPLSPLIEGFRFALLGKGTFDSHLFLSSCIFTVLIFFSGMLLFNKVEKTFMDTV